MALITAWQPNESSDQVRAHLAQGGCVVLPSESTYEFVASPLHPRAIQRLASVVPAGGLPAIVFTSQPALMDWLPLARGASVRLIRKLGPGPYLLRADARYRAGLWMRLPASTQAMVARDDRLALRWPNHAVWDELARTELPLVTVSLPNCSSAAAAAQAIGEGEDLVIDAGNTQFANLPSVVHVEGRHCKLEREGALARDVLSELLLCRILFICTGNTCRSPMAQALCTKLLADRIGCPQADLKSHGFLVQSAGLAAMMGVTASAEAVQVAEELGADLSGHQSAMVTLEMLQWADHVFTMTSSHWYSLLSVPNSGFPVPRMLSPYHEDIADPIGGPLVDYRTCAQQITACLQLRLPEILES